MQYPVYRDNPAQGAINTLRAATFGKTSLPTAREWVESGFKNFSAKETACYQGMMDAGVSGKDAFELLRSIREAEKTDEESQAQQKRKILQEADISGEGKTVVYYKLMASDSERELMDTLTGMDADMGEVTKALMGIKDAGALKGADASNAKRDAISGTALSDAQKAAIYRDRISDTHDEKISAFSEAGMDFDQFLKVQNQYTSFNEQFDSASERATAFSHWVNGQDFTKEQAETVRENFRYFSQIPQEAKRYDGLVEAGLSDNTAYKLANILDTLEPEEGKSEVSALQRCRAVVEADLSQQEQEVAFSAIMGKEEYSKFQTGVRFGVTPAAYVRYQETLPKFDADGNGSLKQQEVPGGA